MRPDVAIKRVSQERILEWARLRKGALVLLEPALLWKVSWPGFSGVVRLLDWFEVPEGFALLMEHPQRCQHLWYFLHERRFLTEPVARGLLRQVLEAVRCRSSHGVLLGHIKAENALVHLATGEAKLIDFGCSTILQDTFYTQMSAGEEVDLLGSAEEDYTWCPDRTGKRLQHPWSASSASATPGATVCRDSPFQKDEDLVRDRLLSWQQLSRGC
ncbi:serine/threonine-protein kinase pim-1-like [Melozone crissalis]|uniref:serine/threonine-protein kinase pim-1-like n=1 Tax=Melozone crissalis TaxID=40204 RepID=UPI0023DB9AB9|nr:serine/threonine-protein kinase pim-1-like [Melozone crissalis]